MSDRVIEITVRTEGEKKWVLKCSVPDNGDYEFIEFECRKLVNHIRQAIEFGGTIEECMEMFKRHQINKRK